MSPFGLSSPRCPLGSGFCFLQSRGIHYRAFTWPLGNKRCFSSASSFNLDSFFVCGFSIGDGIRAPSVRQAVSRAIKPGSFLPKASVPLKPSASALPSKQTADLVCLVQWRQKSAQSMWNPVCKGRGNPTILNYPQLCFSVHHSGNPDALP